MLMGKAVFLFEESDSAASDAGHPAAHTHPEGAIGGCQSSNIFQLTLVFQARKSAVLETGESPVRSEPEGAIGGGENRPHEIIRQTIFFRELPGLPVGVT